METTCKTFVRFYFGGSSEVREVAGRDLHSLEVPKYAFSLMFFDVLSSTVDHHGEPVTLKSERINESPIHYFHGTVYSLEEAKKAVEDFDSEDLRQLLYEIGHKRGGSNVTALFKPSGYQHLSWYPLTKESVYLESASL